MYVTKKHVAEFSEWLLLLFVAFAVLWKGGKSLETTWLLGFLALFLTGSRYVLRMKEKEETSSAVSPGLWWLLVTFLALSVLSFVYSTTRNYGLDELIRDVSLFLIFLWTADRFRSPHADRFCRGILTTVSVAALAACVIGVLVYVLQPVNRFVGTFFDYRFTTDYWPNAWAQFLLLSWPIAVLWSRRFTTVIRALLIGVVLGSLFLSFSRGAFLVFWGQVVLGAVLIVVKRLKSGSFLRHDDRKTALTAIGTVLTALLLFAGVNAVRSHFHPVESVTAKATFTASEGATSISERQDFWSQALTLSLEKPWLGWGPYSFRFIQPRLQTEVFSTSDHPHNVFLKFAMERGWPLTILFALILAWILIPAGLSLLTHKDWTEHDAIRATAIVAVIGVLMHNLIDYNLQFVGIVILFWILCGIILIEPKRKTKKLNTRMILIGDLLLALILTIVLFVEGRMLVLSSLGRHAEAAMRYEKAVQMYEKAEAQVFSRDMYLSQAALTMEYWPDYAKKVLDKYERENAEDARLWILRGRVDLPVSKEAALESYSRALTLAKYNYLEPLEGFLQVSSREEVQSRKEEFIGIFTKFGEAILRNTHFIAQSQSVEVFGRVSQLLMQRYPQERKTLEAFTKDVLEHAEKERAKSQSRTPGLLW